jgi:hypothetical protein
VPIDLSGWPNQSNAGPAPARARRLIDLSAGAGPTPRIFVTHKLYVESGMEVGVDESMERLTELVARLTQEV